MSLHQAGAWILGGGLGVGMGVDADVMHGAESVSGDDARTAPHVPHLMHHTAVLHWALISM